MLVNYYVRLCTLLDIVFRLLSSLVKSHDDIMMTKSYDRLLSSSLLFNSTKASLDSVMFSRKFMKEWHNPGGCLATMCWPAIAEPSIPSIYTSISTRCLGYYGHHAASAGNMTDPGLRTLSHQGKDFPCVLPFNRLWSSKTSERWASCMFVLDFWGCLGKGGKLDRMRDPWDIGVQWKAIVLRALEAACLGDFTVPVTSFFMMLPEETLHPPLWNIHISKTFKRCMTIYALLVCSAKQLAIRSLPGLLLARAWSCKMK